MDKARDVVRRGASRFSPARPHNNNNVFSGVGGDFVHSERSKKERLRRLSAFGVASSSYEDCEMGCDVSERENELPLQAPSMSVGSSRRFRIPKKFLDDCNGVDHASVPRKLRSAMKKRNRESISPPFPDSKKLNQVISGTESPIKNGVKKSKLNMKQGRSDWSPKQAVSGPITKDEEEVVETLYALAGMFPNNDANEKSKLDSESLEAKASALPQSKESPTPALEDSAVTKDNLSLMPSKTADTANASSNVKRSPKETAKVNSLNEPSVEEQPDLPGSKKIRTEADCSVSHLNLQTLTFLAKSENNNEKPLRDSELSLDNRLTLPQPETPLIDRKPEIALGPAITVASQLEQQHTMKEPKKNEGPALWPGLSSVVSHGVGSHSPSLQSSVATVPAWLDAACASGQSSFERGSSTVKVSKGSVDRRSWKRCASHVYISHLIQISQMPENQERLPLQPNQLRPQEGSKLGVLMTINNFHGVRTGLNEVVSPNSVGNSTVERNSTEAKSGIFQHQRFHQDQPQAALASGACSSQKQSLDFLSLSAGGGGMEAKNSVNRAGLESLSQFQVPYFHSLAQKQTLMSFSMPQTCYTSSAYPDQFSLAAAAATQQLQLPPYLGSAYCGPYSSPTALTKQLQQQQLQQQQRLRSAQLAAQYRPVGTSTSMTQFPNWQQGRQDSPMLIPCTQAAIPPHPSSLEVLDPKYTPISQQQQQQLMAISSSLPPARLKRQDHLLPSVYEESGGAFHASGPLPLQLLCNERL